MFSAVFRPQIRVSDLFFFSGEIKGFCQSSLGNKVDFTDIMNILQIYWLQISKTETVL